jgi:predicted phospho-2-dehydro-3-deoxyheptonate aldolase
LISVQKINKFTQEEIRRVKILKLGKEVRLGRIIDRKSGKALIIAMDHAPVSGPIGPGLTKPIKTIETMAKAHPNAIMIHRGLIKLAYKHLIENNLPFILKLTTTTMLGPTPDKTTLVDAVENAIKIGATGVSMRTFIGPKYESEMLRDLGTVSVECEKWGIPLFAMMYPETGDPKRRHDVGYVKHAARVGAELGADIVKTYYTGSSETFKLVVESCPVPVVMAGGPKTKTPLEFLKVAKGVIKAGAIGVMVGRNVWQYKDPAAMIRAIKKVVHENASPEEAEKELTV